MAFINANCERVCVENPVGYMNTKYRKPNQTIHPYFFAKDEQDEVNFQKKRTCLWLKGLAPLERKTFLPEPKPIYVDKISGKKDIIVKLFLATVKTVPRIVQKHSPALQKRWG